jgi:anti-sigma regulatory factor (Ser/Thr protein kinase)
MSGGGPSPMRHDLFVYDDDARFAAHMAPFVRGGLDRDEAVVAVLNRDHASVLRGALGPGTDRVSFADSDGLYTRPEAAVASYDATVRRLLRDGARGVRFIRELPPELMRDEWETWLGYEAILNRAFAHHPVSIMCVYDSRLTPAEVLAQVGQAHPSVLGESLEPNAGFHAPEDIMRSLVPEPQALPELHALPLNGGGGAAELRDQLVAAMHAANVAPEAARDLLQAAGEVAVNARRHAGGLRGVRAGRVGEHFVCELSDAGPGLDDPMAGHVPPRPDGGGGVGLWVARQVTRRLEVLPRDPGTTVRLWV